MTFKELNLREPEVVYTQVKLDSGVEVNVRNYLPIDSKADMITWVINSALDDNTGCISPIRFEVCFALGIMKWYADIEIDEDIAPSEAYDILEQHDVINQIIGAIPISEMDFMRDLATDTAEDITRYNNSFAGMMSLMSKDAENLDSQLTNLINQVENPEELKQLKAIRDVVGSN